jgi:hypothetical protein
MEELTKDLCTIKVRITPPKVGYYLHAEIVGEWLEHNVGKFKDTWDVIYNGSMIDYYFQDEVTATFFALRWA